MAASPPLTLDGLNAATSDAAAQMLDGLYEHSPWIAREALAQRPFVSLAHLKYTMTQVLAQAGRAAQLALIRAHPELAGKAMVTGSLTEASQHEQRTAGLTQCTAEELRRLQVLNADYQAKFGFPFVLAVRGPRGNGLSKHAILATFERRLQGHPDFEVQECLRNIHRIAELRLNDRFGFIPTEGNRIWDWQEALAEYSEAASAQRGELTVTYLTDAHRACAERIRTDMHDCGCDTVHIDAVGNVVGRYHAAPGTAAAPARYLLTGSHYDTVRDAGKYDGRLGIYVPLACVRQLAEQGRRLPYGLEIVAFAEEEGQRFKATYLGSSALTGDFDPAWLEQRDADGVSLREAMQGAGLCLADIPGLRRKAEDYLGFVEVHIEQGPVLNELKLPLGLVTSINAAVRFAGEVLGQASHAGTTPMDRRRDAAAAVAELLLYVERRAAQAGDAVGTVGMLQVPNGSVNVVPGRCEFSLDLRAPNDAQRDALVEAVQAEFAALCARRAVQGSLRETMRSSAAPSAPAWLARWERAVTSLGLPCQRLASGAGHDAGKLHALMPQAMLFVRGENGGISHNPLESSTADDMQLAAQAFMHLLTHLPDPLPPAQEAAP